MEVRVLPRITVEKDGMDGTVEICEVTQETVEEMTDVLLITTTARVETRTVADMVAPLP